MRLHKLKILKNATTHQRAILKEMCRPNREVRNWPLSHETKQVIKNNKF